MYSALASPKLDPYLYTFLDSVIIGKAFNKGIQVIDYNYSAMAKYKVIHTHIYIYICIVRRPSQLFITCISL